jgi:putative transcriptional regulator
MIFMKPRHEIRNHLRRHRLLADGMSQQELADRVGVTRQTILSIEKGKYSPTITLALRLAETFGVAVEDLFELEKGNDAE